MDALLADLTNLRLASHPKPPSPTKTSSPKNLPTQAIPIYRGRGPRNRTRKPKV
jgi:hypothetical protein